MKFIERQVGMSGGSYDYFYVKIIDFANRIEIDKKQPAEVAWKRDKFRRLLYLVADAAHAIEWVDSDDWGPGDEMEALTALDGWGKDDGVAK